MSVVILLSAVRDGRHPLVQDTLIEVVPGERAGPVRSTSTGVDLMALLGPDARPAPGDIGEGFTEPGLALFPEDPTRRAYVYWRDTSDLTQPSRVLIMGAATRWCLPLGLTIGTTLEELEGLNGRPFEFGGLDWDSGGGVGSWSGGKLDIILGPGMRFRPTLVADCAERAGKAYGEIVGEVIVASTHPAARRACIRVSQIWIDFESP